MKLVTAIVRPAKLDDIMDALEKFGVQGVTISQASGYGQQKGHKEVYRGAEYAVNLVQKVRVEVLVVDSAAADVVAVIVETSKTGRAGDGKVWTITVDDAIRVRTGESGADAV